MAQFDPDEKVCRTAMDSLRQALPFEPELVIRENRLLLRAKGKTDFSLYIGDVDTIKEKYFG